MPAEQLTAREVAWRDYPADAEVILDRSATPATKCRQPLCRADVWWGRTAATGARSCFDIKPDGTRTGTNHWRTCRDRPERSKKPKRKAT